MEQTLKDLCAKHELTGISVHLFRADTDPFVSVSFHWDEETVNRGISSGNGDTFKAACAVAASQMAERRTARAA